MQSFAQETIKIRKNRRKDIFKTSPSNYFCTFLAPVYLSAPASLTGILEGVLQGLERFAPVKVTHRPLSASRSPVRDEAPQAPLPGCGAAALLARKVAAVAPHQGRSYAEVTNQPSLQLGPDLSPAFRGGRQNQ